MKDTEEITLRDYFAAKAMQGAIASLRPLAVTENSDRTTAEQYSKFAFAIADAMLKAREL